MARIEFNLKICLRALAPIAILLASATSAAAHDVGRESIEQALQSIAAAAESQDISLAATIFADDLVLISQSGKVYGREAALADLGSGFSVWRNEEIVIRVDVRLAIVTLINHRTRIGMESASFRVTQIWQPGSSGDWQIRAQTSVRLP